MDVMGVLQIAFPVCVYTAAESEEEVHQDDVIYVSIKILNTSSLLSVSRIVVCECENPHGRYCFFLESELNFLIIKNRELSYHHNSSST